MATNLPDIFREEFGFAQDSLPLVAPQPPTPQDSQPAPIQVPPIADLFGARPAPPPLPDEGLRPTGAPGDPTSTGGAQTPSQGPQIDPAIMQQAALLQAALTGGGGFLPSLGQSFGVGIPPVSGGTMQPGPGLNSLLGPVLSQISSQLSPSLLGIPEIASILDPSAFATTTLNPTQRFGGFGGQGGQGFPQSQPLNPALVGPALQAIQMLLSGGG